MSRSTNRTNHPVDSCRQLMEHDNVISHWKNSYCTKEFELHMGEDSKCWTRSHKLDIQNCGDELA